MLFLMAHVFHQNNSFGRNDHKSTNFWVILLTSKRTHELNQTDYILGKEVARLSGLLWSARLQLFGDWLETCTPDRLACSWYDCGDVWWSWLGVNLIVTSLPYQQSSPTVSCPVGSITMLCHCWCDNRYSIQPGKILFQQSPKVLLLKLLWDRPFQK